MSKFWKEAKDYIIIIVIVLLVRTFIGTPAIVNGDSMNDNLLDGQMVIINKFIYRFKDIKRFDVVVVDNEQDGDKIIKRVIGLPNETIIYRNNKLYINSEEVKLDVDVKETMDFEYKTKDGEYFVLGDNRPVSKDSRYLGAFTKDDIVGRVDIRLWPINKIGLIKGGK